MKSTRLFAVAVLALSLSACDSSISTPDGKIPAQYVDAAKALMGTYQGTFNSKAAQLTLSLDGAAPVVEYTDAMGHDIIGKLCGSSIGKLIRVAAPDQSKGGSIDEATFEFNPGACPVQGREITLSFNADSANQKVSVGVSILRDSYVVQDPGYPVCTVDAHGHTFCYVTGGGIHTITNYLDGHFIKTN